jgi:hypothetical protein
MENLTNGKTLVLAIGSSTVASAVAAVAGSIVRYTQN